MQSEEDKKYCIGRRFDENKVYLFEGKSEDFDIKKSEELSSTHSSVSENNISKYLLDLIDLKNNKLRKNADNKLKDISFSDVKLISVVDENRIISEVSPICSPGVYDTTKEDSFLKLILSEQDDHELEQIENAQIYKSRIRGKIELINENLASKKEKLKDLKEKTKELGSEEVNIKIKQFTNLIESFNKEIFYKETKRLEIWKNIEKVRAELEQIIKLKQRFILLKKHYESDLERIDFIYEGKQYLDQLSSGECPICNSKISSIESLPFGEIKNSLLSEFAKIEIKLKELTSTLEGLNTQEKATKENFEKLTNELKSIDDTIEKKLKPLIDLNKEKLNSFLEYNEDRLTIELIEEELKELSADLIYHQAKEREKISKPKGRIIASELYVEFCECIKYFTEIWGFGKDVEYDLQKNDIKISGKSRQNYGKGHRAIFLTAYLMGLLKFCIDNDKKHPKFIVFDTPVNSYKEGETIEVGDEIPEEVKDKIFKSLPAARNLLSLVRR